MNRHVLIIDDNPAIHEDFAKILAPVQTPSTATLDHLMSLAFGGSASPVMENFELTFATQGQQGVALAADALTRGRPFALAFVDIRVPPGWDGVETIARMWEVDPNIQVVICTAYMDYTWSDILRRLGVSDRLLILKKPFDCSEVLQLAHALSCKWQLREENQRHMERLDRLVRERTAEVQNANMALRAEIAEHKRALEQCRLTGG